MKKQLLSFFLTVLSAGFSWSQCVYTCSNYAVSPVTYTTFPVGQINVVPNFTNSMAGTVPDDGSTGPIPIGFNFDFYCNTYTDVHICSNGFITFDYQPFSWPTPYVHPTQSLPDVAYPNGMIAFNMTDLDPTTNGTITYTTVGIAPNRQFIVTFSNVPCFSAPTDLNTGQIVLFETSNLIEIHTTSAKPDANQLALGSTQGIENTTGTLSITPPGRNANNAWGSGSNNTAYKFSPYVATPPSSITGNTLLCQGDVGSYQATFIVGANNYNWTFPSGWIGTSSISAVSSTAGAGGTISVSATYTCGTSAPTVINVTVNPAPIVSITSVTPVIICSGKTITMTASGALSYTVYPGGFGGSTSSFTDMPMTTTTYTLYGTNAQGCVSLNNPNSMVTVNQTPLVSVNSGSMCLGQTFTITPAGAPNYVITGNFFNVTPTTPGPYTYVVVGTGTNGCLSDPVTSSLTVFALPTLSVSATRTVMCTKESIVLTASGANTYLWATNSTATVITISPTTNTNYVVTGTDVNGCKNAGMIDIVVKPCTGVDALTAELHDVSVYPNPTTGTFDVKLNSVSEKTTIEVYNALGERIISEKVGAEITNINLKSYSAGLYYVKIKNADAEKTIKVIKH